VSDTPKRAYHVTHIADVANGLSAMHTSYNLDDDASFEVIEGRAALLDRVLWARVAAMNERKWVKNEVVQHERRERIKLAKAAGKKVRESDVLQDEIALHTAQVAIEAELRANAKLDGKDPDALMARLREEAEKHKAA
jgi:hypothetical protein